MEGKKTAPLTVLMESITNGSLTVTVNPKRVTSSLTINKKGASYNPGKVADMVTILVGEKIGSETIGTMTWNWSESSFSYTFSAK